MAVKRDKHNYTLYLKDDTIGWLDKLKDEKGFSSRGDVAEFIFSLVRNQKELIAAGAALKRFSTWWKTGKLEEVLSDVEKRILDLGDEKDGPE